MWSYKPSNLVRLDPNKRCAPPLPRSSGLINDFLSKVGHVSLKIKRSKISSLVSKFKKPPKPQKAKFVAKPSLKNQHRYRVHRFNQSMFEPIKNPSKTL